jgi:hypothetical protein
VVSLNQKGGEKMQEIMECLKNGEGQLLLVLTILLGLTPEEIDKFIKVSKVKSLETEEEEA